MATRKSLEEQLEQLVIDSLDEELQKYIQMQRNRIETNFAYLAHSGVVAWVAFGALLAVFLVSRFASDVLEPLWIKSLMLVTAVAALAALAYPFFDDVLKYPLANVIFSLLAILVFFAVLMMSKARFAKKDAQFRAMALRTAQSLELSGNYKVAQALRSASVDILGHLQVRPARPLGTGVG